MWNVGGANILEAHIHMPPSGAWAAEVVLDTDSGPGPGEAATLDFEPLRLVGTAVRGGVAFGVTTLMVVGGKGGLGVTMTPKDYRGVPVKVPLGDVLEASGEQLSEGCENAALTYQLPRWVRFAQSASEAVDGLAKACGRSWRVLVDGTVWLGTETWPEVAPEHDLLQGDPHLGTVEVATEAPLLFPGLSFLGANIQNVEHTVAAHRVRSVVTFS